MSAPEPKEIRECYADYRSEWQEIRDEAIIDMRYVAGDPWEPEDRAAREDAGRPCVSLDELNQYLNQYVNNLRQTKRAIQTTPKGDGANDQDAKKRSSLIKGIEERSNAPTGVYIPAAQSAAERSYGFAVIRTEYKDEDSFDQEILIKPVLNPDTVLLNPNYKQADASDVSDAFLLDLMPKAEFKQKFGKKSDITDFSDDAATGISDWIKDKYVQVGEFWKIQHTYKTLLLIETEKGRTVFTEDEWKAAKGAGMQGSVKRDRRVEIPNVMQYLTNGKDILDEIPWAGSRIPIISCFGKELWMTEGGRAKRKLLSLVRLARDPQMLFAFLATQECEEAGMVPKVPFIGYKGQFETDAAVWAEINQVPHTHVQVDVMIDAVTGQVLPLPTRPQWVPNFQQYELAKDSARRSIQSAFGLMPQTTATQRANQKSGVALDKIEQQEQIGSYHFLDNFENGFLHNMGWQVNELITPILDTPSTMPVTQPDGKRSTMHIVGNTSHPINDKGVYEVQGLPADHMHTGKGDFDVTISSGPSQQSEREEQDEFVDSLITNVANLPQPGTPQAKVLALGIRMRPSLGAIGGQISDIFDPPPADPNMPPQAQAAIQQLQAALQQAQQESAALHMEHAGKVLEQQTKIILQQMKNDNATAVQQLQNDIKVLIAEIQTKAQDESERRLLFREVDSENHSAAHEVGKQAMEHQHDAQESAQQRELAAQTANQDPEQQGQPNPTGPSAQQ
jgi:hypothetical protein